MTYDVTVVKLDPDAHEQRFRRLRRDLGVESFGINLLVMEPGQRSRIHRHEQPGGGLPPAAGRADAVRRGRARSTCSARVTSCASAPTCAASSSTAGRERLELLALGGHGAHEGRDGKAYAAWEEEGAGRSPADVPFPADE